MPSRNRAKLLKICGISLLALPLKGQAQTDTLARKMDTVVVTQRVAATSVALRSDGSLWWNAKAFDVLPKVLGNADPVRCAQMLPGVQTNSELDAGLHVQGSDNTHNLLAIQGVPIYNAAHLLGIFSVFNASHYAAMNLKKGPNAATDPSRLGATLSMDHQADIPDSVHGELSVGLISSQGTLRLPTGRRSGLTLSARASYLNLLYSRWLTASDMSLRYRFGDANLTWQWQPNVRNRLWLDAYWGMDNVRAVQDEYQGHMKLRWGNALAALHWLYDRGNGLTVNSRAFYTRYDNRLRLSQGEMLFSLPSDIADLGLHSHMAWRGWRAGAELVWHNIQPQNPQAQNIYNQSLPPQPRQHTQEYILFADYTRQILPHFEATAGVRTTAYVDDIQHLHLAADPSIRLSYTRERWQLALDYALRHQYLFQTGTSSLGMPTEFWMSVGSSSPPQWGHNLALSAAIYLFDGRYRLSADVYYRRLHHQVEYDGDIMKFLNSDYCVTDNLLYGRGHNYGLSVMVAKRTGRLTGWLSYAYGRARRQFAEDGYQRTYSASHERPHEVNFLASYRLGRCWTLSATYVFASGTPFTAPEHFYIMNGMLLTQYGPHNARRLRPYRRLDLSVNYLLPTRHLRQSGLNLSLYNATMRHNDIACRLKVHGDHYLYSHFGLIKFILPSISYFMKF